MADEVRVPNIEEKLDRMGRLLDQVLVKLFGDVDADTPHGRLPLIERTQADHEERLKRLETFFFKVLGACLVLGFIAGLMDLGVKIYAAVKH